MTDITTGSAASNLNPRQREILEVARDARLVQVEPLAQRFKVTPQTIRRDLNLLCNLRLLQRTHGGAIASGGVSNMGYPARLQLAADAKASIGRAADRPPPASGSAPR